MGALLQPSPENKERDSGRRMIVISVAVVFVLAVIVAFALRSRPTEKSGPPPYAANIKLSDPKTGAAENFVGATINYIGGTVTNSGTRTVTHVVVEVSFKDELGQLAQREAAPLKILKTGGPYPEAIDLSISPLPPGQSQPFLLTFEGISTQWNHQYPEIEIADVVVK
jgi:heme/copper-type cytochrome/quinol oxidase subunit 2